MTDKERRELVEYLRNPGHDFRGDRAFAEETVAAADEIERLATENKKLRDDAEWDRHVEGCRARKHYK